MSLSNTIGNWAKELKKTQHIGAGITPAQRIAGREIRPERKDAKKAEKKMAVAKKMQNSGYPAKFISAREQEIE
jgi:hypothetical protein